MEAAEGHSRGRGVLLDECRRAWAAGSIGGREELDERGGYEGEQRHETQEAGLAGGKACGAGAM